MLTTQLTPTLRAALKRLIRTRSMLLVNANGDLSDFETLVRLHPVAPRGTWHTVGYSDIKKLFAAEEITTSDTGVSVRTGVRTDDLDTEPLEAEHTPDSLDPEASTLTLDSAEGQNHAAIKVLATTASTDDMVPVLTVLHINGNTADERNTGDSADRHVPTGETTDRHQATIATLTAEPAKVDALVAAHLFQEAAKRSAWTMTITDDMTSIEYEDLGIIASAKNLTDAQYPRIRRLFPSERDDQASISVRPKALGSALKSLAVERNAPAVLTSDGTLFAEATPEVEVPGAHGTMRGEASDTIGLSPVYLMRQCKAVGARWDDVLISWGESHKPATLSYGHGIEGIIMPVRHPLSRPGEVTASAA